MGEIVRLRINSTRSRLALGIRLTLEPASPAQDPASWDREEHAEREVEGREPMHVIDLAGSFASADLAVEFRSIR